MTNANDSTPGGATDRELAYRLERIEAESGVAIFDGTGDQPGGAHIHRVGGAVVRLDPGGRLSNVKCLGLGQPVTDATLDEVEDLFRPYGYPFTITPSPLAQPQDIDAILTARGFTRQRSTAKVYRRTESPLPEFSSDLRVVEAGPREAEALAQTLAGGFGMPIERGRIVAATAGKPAWRWFLALADGTPVGVGGLYVADRAGWLGYGATLPSHRGRGAQSLLIAARVAAARDMGCDVVTSDTWEDTPEDPVSSFRNMVRNGFDLLYTRPNYQYRFEDA